MSADIKADFTRTCEGCPHVLTETWEQGTVFYRCGAEGRCKGYIVGIKRLMPYVPAWCPEMEDKPCTKN